MKLKYLERGVAVIFLLVNINNLFLVADSVWRGIGWLQNYRGPQTPSVFLNAYFVPTLLVYVAYYISFTWVVTGLPYRYLLGKRFMAAFLTAFAGFMLAWITISWGNFLKLPFSNKPFDRFGLLRDNLKDGAQLCIFYGWMVIYIAFKQFCLWFWNKYRTQPWRLSILIPSGQQAQKSRHNILEQAWLYDVVLLTLLWVVSFFVVSFFNLSHWVKLFVLLVVPCFFITCILTLHWLIPAFYNRKSNTRFWAMEFLVTFGLNLPLTGIFCAAGTHSPFMLVTMFIVFWVGQLAVAIPATYLIYRRRKDIAQEMEGLQTDLNASEANLDLLRMQINPHFLFNALNSLYGMALVEQAEKTGEGIQLLGDMMRFMLHENNQKEIALSAEIGYLKNYINLQHIRLASSPDIKIGVDIAEADTPYNIAPMLLVPFVENAYKHGVSFQEPSWINVSLSVKNRQLQFDVSNSIHPSRENDPERDHSGIGLENVKQRLALLYPGQHNLLIRKTETEFSIYLNLQLK